MPSIDLHSGLPISRLIAHLFLSFIALGACSEIKARPPVPPPPAKLAPTPVPPPPAKLAPTPVPPPPAKLAPQPNPLLPACLHTQAGCPTQGSTPWVESTEGFVTHWQLTEFPARRWRQRPTQLAQNATFHPTHTPTGLLPLAPAHPRRAKDRAWLATADFYLDAPTDLRLLTSINGIAELYLNDTRTFEETGDQYLLPDHRTTRLHLPAGRHRIALKLKTKAPYETKLMLRLRAPDGARLPTLWLLSTPAPSPCSALSLTLQPDHDDGAWSLRAASHAHGLLPWPLPRAIHLHTPTGPLSFPFSERFTHTLSAPPPGDYTLAIDDIPCLTHTHAPDTTPDEAHTDRALRRLLADPTQPTWLKHLLQYHRDRAWRATLSPSPLRALIWPYLQRLVTQLTDAPASQLALQPGPQLRAYPSPYTGELQDYILVLPPPSPAPPDGYALIFLMHGLRFDPEDMAAIALGHPAQPGQAQREGWLYQDRLPPSPPGTILAAPRGYDAAGHRAPGEHDLLAVLDAIQEQYPIDPQRISITGFSLGGSTAFWAPLHFPGLFAASAPLCGYPDLNTYSRIRGHRKTAWEPRLLREEDAITYTQQRPHLPFQIFHGTRDTPIRSENMHAALREAGHPATLALLDAGHKIWDEVYADLSVLTWLSQQRRAPFPKELTIHSGRYRWAQSHWLRVTAFEDGDHFGRAHAQLKGQDLSIQTRHVRALRLDLSPFRRADLSPLALTIDDQPLPPIDLTQTMAATVDFHRSAGRWHVRESPGDQPAVTSPPQAHKKAGVEGPIGDIWYAPLTVVYGTQRPLEIEANRLVAEKVARFSPWSPLRVPIFADTELPPEKRRGQGLIIVGRPETLSFGAELEKSLRPLGLSFGPDQVRFGGKTYAGTGLGVSLAWPNPWDPDHLMVLHAGQDIDGTLSARYLPDLSPDYLIYDGRMRHVFGDRILGKRAALQGGFFNEDWSLPPL